MLRRGESYFVPSIEVWSKRKARLATWSIEPPIVVSRSPETASVASRTLSASSLRTSPRQWSTLVASTSSARLLVAQAAASLASRHVRDWRMSRCICFTDQPDSTNSTASQSRSAWLVGFSP